MTEHAPNYELAVSEAERGNWEAAERYARAAVTLGGDQYAGCLGKILIQLGKYDEARTCLLRAVAVQRTDPDVLFYLGSMSDDLGMRDEALAYFEQALLLRPDFPPALWSRDRVLRDQRFFQAVRDTLCAFARNKGLSDSDAFALGEVEFPSESVEMNGAPRFTMQLPASLILTDRGAALLFYREVAGRGYEFALRRFLDLHLSSDDVFIDVGAHWGIHALTAATRWRREISVLAAEPHPENTARLRSWVERNQLEEDIEIVPAAIADRQGIARLVVNGSSMGHSLRAASSAAPPNAIDVSMTTLDSILNERAHLRYRPIILKIDVEGCELEAFMGAKQLFATGAVKAIIWEKASFHEPQVQDQRNKAIFDFLRSYAFEHFYMRDENGVATLMPLEGNDAPCDVYSLARGFERKENYR